VILPKGESASVILPKGESASVILPKGESASVILPKGESASVSPTGDAADTTIMKPKKRKQTTVDMNSIKDSKKFTSKTKLREVAEYIKQNAIAWAVAYVDEKTIDRCNILQATQTAMHDAIGQVLAKIEDWSSLNTVLEIDGNYFRKFPDLDHDCFEGGDATHKNIAAASILAKLARDDYMDELCIQYPRLAELYGLNKNYGYGTKQHMDAIRQYGITPWHRRSFGLCKNAYIHPEWLTETINPNK
jgi:ribonuclease HII